MVLPEAMNLLIYVLIIVVVIVLIVWLIDRVLFFTAAAMPHIERDTWIPFLTLQLQQEKPSLYFST